jgi:hypothetical protein
MPKKLPVKESEKARTYLGDAFMNNKNFLKRLQALITAAAMEVPEFKGDPQKAALAIRDTLSVLWWQTIEYNTSRQAEKIIELKKKVKEE